MNSFPLILSLVLILFASSGLSQVFSSLINGFMVRSNEEYSCAPGSFFKQITRSSIIRSYRPDCNPVQVRGEGRNKFQAINWNGKSGLFDADVERIFNVKENQGQFRMNYTQSGPIIEKISFSECDGGQVLNEQEYLYDYKDCSQPYLHLNSVKAFLHIGGKCHSVCWGKVTLK